MAASPKTSENDVWHNWMEKANLRFTDDLHMCRIENSVGVGATDVEGMLLGAPFYIELKSEARPARESTFIKFRFQSSQHYWSDRRYKAGGYPYILAQVGGGHQARRYLIPMSERNIKLMEGGVLEEWLITWSVVDPKSPAWQVVDRATRSWSSPS